MNSELFMMIIYVWFTRQYHVISLQQCLIYVHTYIPIVEDELSYIGIRFIVITAAVKSQ